MRNGSQTYVALLRGINLGSRNRLAMSDLKRIFEDAGCKDVRTFIQSGNVIFHATKDIANLLPQQIAAAVEESFGLRVPVILRTADEMAAAVAANPFLGTGYSEDALSLMFLADRPAAAAVAALDPLRSAPDSFSVWGREIYLHTPKSFHKTKLTNAWFDGKLSTVSTVRNWRTSVRLAELMKN